MQYPVLAKIKLNEYNRIRYGDQPLAEITISIPTVRFTSHPDWRRTKFNYNLKDGETVVAIQEQRYNYGRYDYTKSVHILPLIPILTGATKRAAIKWKHCKAYYPTFQMQELTYLDGTPWVSEEQIKKEEDEYNEKMRQYHQVMDNVAPPPNWGMGALLQQNAIPIPPAQNQILQEAVDVIQEAQQQAMDNGDALLRAFEDINLDFLDDPQQGFHPLPPLEDNH